MARPKIDGKIKAARREHAGREAGLLNPKLPKRVYASITPAGKVIVRYEPKVGRKITLTAPFPSPEFLRQLADAQEGRKPARRVPQPASKAAVATTKTWRWLCESFIESNGFLKFAERERRVRRKLLEQTWDEPLWPDDPAAPCFGDLPIEDFRTNAIKILRDRRAQYIMLPDPMYPDDRAKDKLGPSKPEAGNSVVRFARLVLGWAVEAHTDAIEQNWAAEVKLLPSAGSGFATWGQEQFDTFEGKHLPGSRERLIYDLARCTAQRLSDLARLGSHMVGRSPRGVERLAFRQSKGRNGAGVTAYVPMTPELRAALDVAGRSGVLGRTTWIAKRDGSPYTAESLGNLFTTGCQDAGLVGYSLHGLRKAAVVEMITRDFSFFQIMAITGHRTRKEIERYGREYLREHAMEEAFLKWRERHRHDADVADDALLDSSLSLRAA